MLPSNLPQPDRRAILRSISGASLVTLVPSLGFAADFWVKKKPSEWSSDEVEHFKTKSPWAKKTRAEVTGMGGGRGGRGGGGMGGGGETAMNGSDMSAAGGGGGGGRGGGGGGRGGGGGDMAPPAPSAPQGPELVIRWESAAPMLAASHMELPDNVGSLYMISMTGMPPQMLAMALLGGGRGRGRGPGGPGAGAAAEPGAPPPPVDPAAQQKELVAKLLRATTLTVKGHDPQIPIVVLQTKVAQSLLFGFEKSSLPLKVEDKEVLFTFKLPTISAKVKFGLKEMMMDGALAV
jgi:hypothetical protein